MKKHLFPILLCLCLATDGLAQTTTSVGTDFWIAFPPNYTSITTLKLFISSTFSTNGSVYSSFPGVSQNFTVVPGVVTQLDLPSLVALQGGIENKGIRITSTEPVSVYGLNWYPSTTDAFLALPVNALGLDYRIITYKASSASMGSCFSVVATQNGTSLTIFNHQTNSTININLDQGQTYHVKAFNIGDDVTGSRIQSNFPVAMFGSEDMVNIPSSCDAADHIVEQMFPYYSWGKNFVTVPLAGRDGSGDIFRIVAAVDGTDISLNGLYVATINAGAYYETNLTGYNAITTSKATLLAQFAKGMTCTGNISGDPLMMLIPPKEQFLTNYTIANVAGFSEQWVNVVAPDYAMGTIFQDGVLIPNSAFTQIGSTTFYGAQRSVTEGSHTFTSTAPFGVFVYGWNNVNSYGYPGGCSLSPVGTVSSVTLSPPADTGILNLSTLCFTAHVEDDLQHAVAGVLVTFNISGIGNITGTGYTDTLGNTQYCYTRTGTTTGTDSIYAECFGYTSNTSRAIWTLCVNPTNPGSIGSDQTNCGAYTPAPLTSITLSSGHSGTLEYKWQQSITSSVAGFTDIVGSNAPGYAPGNIMQTTWYRRLARVDCMPDWTAATVTNAIEMTVIPLLIPSVTIVADQPTVCDGVPMNFTATPMNGGANPAYQWKVNLANAGPDSPVFSFIPNDGDNVECVLTSSETICIINNPATSNVLTMTVGPKVPVSVSLGPSPDPVCQGDSVTVTAVPVNGGSSPAYEWQLNGIAAGSDFPMYSYVPEDGDKVSCLLTSSMICVLNSQATASVTITLQPDHRIIDTTLCYGTPYFAQGVWQTSGGTYYDTLATPLSCIRFIETHLGYKPSIPVDLGNDTVLCGNFITLWPHVPGGTYLWQDGSTDSVYVVTLPGKYKVLVGYDGCAQSDSIRIGECPVSIWFPNAFTPNGDGLNDTFHPVGRGIEKFSMQIFNRWGEIIYKKEKVEPGWDGTSQGNLCPEGTYIFKAVFETSDGAEKKVTGTVNLLR